MVVFLSPPTCHLERSSAAAGRPGGGVERPCVLFAPTQTQGPSTARDSLLRYESRFARDDSSVMAPELVGIRECAVFVDSESVTDVTMRQCIPELERKSSINHFLVRRRAGALSGRRASCRVALDSTGEDACRYLSRGHRGSKKI